jgi:rhodanese-related sulfurtransferase
MAGYFEGSVNAKCINMQQKQEDMSGLPKDQKIVVVDDNGNESSPNVNMLVRFGSDAHYLKNGIKSWDKRIVKSK